jgi:hypothetical protein
MKAPFTVDQFLEVFRNYNEAVFPMQVVLYLISALVVFIAVKATSKTNRVISGLLAFLWLWMGGVYHLIFFTAINKAAYVFGAAFMLQGILFLSQGVFQDKLSFAFRADLYGITGVVLILFALIVYPILGYVLGHRYPYSPTFGLPCPTTIFTFGVLLLTNRKFPATILIIPLLWSVVGFTAAFGFGMVEDVGLLVSGLLTVSMLLIRNRQEKRPIPYTFHTN